MVDQVIREAVSRLKAGADVYFGGRALLNLETTAISARRFSVLGRVRADFPGCTQGLVVKVPRVLPRASPEKIEKLRESLRREHDVPRSLNPLLAGFAPDMKAVVPVAFFEDLPALVMEESVGEALSDVVTRARWYPSRRTVADLSERFSAVGRWLRLFQSVTARPAERFSLDAMRQYLEVRLDTLSGLGVPDVGRRWKGTLLRYFDLTAGQVGEDARDVTGVHGDFSLSNVLSTGRETVVLDFSQFEYGSRFYDVTRFHHQVGLLLNKPYFRPSTVQRLRKSFLGGWDQRSDALAPLFRLFTLQHQVCHWLGLVKNESNRIHQHLYNRWACFVQLWEIRRLVSGRH